MKSPNKAIEPSFGAPALSATASSTDERQTDNAAVGPGRSPSYPVERLGTPRLYPTSMTDPMEQFDRLQATLAARVQSLFNSGKISARTLQRLDAAVQSLRGYGAFVAHPGQALAASRIFSSAQYVYGRRKEQGDTVRITDICLRLLTKRLAALQADSSSLVLPTRSVSADARRLDLQHTATDSEESELSLRASQSVSSAEPEELAQNMTTHAASAPRATNRLDSSPLALTDQVVSSWRRPSPASRQAQRSITQESSSSGSDYDELQSDAGNDTAPLRSVRPEPRLAVSPQGAAKRSSRVPAESDSDSDSSAVPLAQRLRQRPSSTQTSASTNASSFSPLDKGKQKATTASSALRQKSASASESDSSSTPLADRLSRKRKAKTGPARPAKTVLREDRLSRLVAAPQAPAATGSSHVAPAAISSVATTSSVPLRSAPSSAPQPLPYEAPAAFGKAIRLLEDHQNETGVATNFFTLRSFAVLEGEPVSFRVRTALLEHVETPVRNAPGQATTMLNFLSKQLTQLQQVYGEQLQDPVFIDAPGSPFSLTRDLITSPQLSQLAGHAHEILRALVLETASREQQRAGVLHLVEAINYTPQASIPQGLFHTAALHWYWDFGAQTRLSWQQAKARAATLPNGHWDPDFVAHHWNESIVASQLHAEPRFQDSTMRESSQFLEWLKQRVGLPPAP